MYDPMYSVKYKAKKELNSSVSSCCQFWNNVKTKQATHTKNNQEGGKEISMLWIY